jgi:hypothetical protein
VLRKQAGVRVDVTVWMQYRDLCARERLRPSEPIDGFLRFVLRCGSAVAVLPMLDRCESSGGFDAYARVLLKWYERGRDFIAVSDESDAPVEHMLLQAVKQVADPGLRRQIEDALTGSNKKRDSGQSCSQEDGGTENSQTGDVAEKIRDLRMLIKGAAEEERGLDQSQLGEEAYSEEEQHRKVIFVRHTTTTLRAAQP